MSDIDVLNARLDHVEERLERGDARFGRGEEKFAEVAEALAAMKGHLTQQDATMASFMTKLDEIKTGTDSIVSTWKGGEKAVRFFCRLADAWTFMLRRFFSPIVLPVAFVWTVYMVVTHKTLPDWAVSAIKLSSAFHQ